MVTKRQTITVTMLDKNSINYLTEANVGKNGKVEFKNGEKRRRGRKSVRPKKNLLTSSIYPRCTWHFDVLNF